MSIADHKNSFGSTYLDAFLQPLLPWLLATDISEILINQAGEIWIERAGALMECHQIPELNETALERLVQQIARINHQGINRKHPLLSATLQNDIRVQAIAPPATRKGIALAFRKNTLTDVTIDDLVKNMPAIAKNRKKNENDKMRELAEKGDYPALLRHAVHYRKTLLLSGGTSTGKTTFLNAMIKEINPQERVIVIEDTPELKLNQPNALGLRAVSQDQGEAQVSIDDLMRAALRMRPDRLIVGELRGPEVVTFLRAINTGHPGSFASIHASSAQGALEQIALMCLQAKLGLSRTEAQAYASTVIDVIIQLGRENGQYIIKELKFLD